MIDRWMYGVEEEIVADNLPTELTTKGRQTPTDRDRKRDSSSPVYGGIRAERINNLVLLEGKLVSQRYCAHFVQIICTFRIKVFHTSKLIYYGVCGNLCGTSHQQLMVIYLGSLIRLSQSRQWLGRKTG